MKNLFYAALLLLSTFAYGQITFENGYFINNNGEKTDVLIKNYDWKNNPTVIEYKIKDDQTPLKIKTSDLQEFSVGDQKYVTAKVMIDRSSSKIENLSDSPNFNSKEETLLLKQLLEGKVSLYRYTDGSITRFFYKKENDNTFKPLNYKEYLVNNNLLQKNEEYKSQLKKEFSDNEKIRAKDIDNLVYRENELMRIFKNYDDLADISSNNKNNFHIYVKSGVGLSHYKILPPSENLSIGEKKENSIAFKAALELEYILNFNKGKWAIFSEPSFQTVKFTVNDYNRRNFRVNFSSIQIPLGFKYNMFLNQKSKIYISTALYYNLMLNKDNFTVDNFSSKASGGLYGYSFGLGYNYDKFGAELKLGTIPNFSSSYYGAYHDMTMDGLNLSLSYKLF
ncbi:hypothetical protein QE422_001581 [Chryseobacterium sp. SORGH_AS 447]|uniref:hypothetical protein n=1 Tax=Chryseobacterium sp. SORGH_AS_0447 TaxID=3041769 RepID=UPI002788433D|nr:hypothetical protein [Chryseobacterium sp. SORGH_AS_0447]MDQ1161213.1 hypothetical protein [Chryseobacterium sp. SORGH_AS_0447]